MCLVCCGDCTCTVFCSAVYVRACLSECVRVRECDYVSAGRCACVQCGCAVCCMMYIVWVINNVVSVCVC